MNYRLDVESKLPNELTLTNITCRPEEKLAVLLVLLKTIIPSDQQTVVFAATRHHVEYLHMVRFKFYYNKPITEIRAFNYPVDHRMEATKL